MTGPIGTSLQVSAIPKQAIGVSNSGWCRSEVLEGCYIGHDLTRSKPIRIHATVRFDRVRKGSRRHSLDCDSNIIVVLRGIVWVKTEHFSSKSPSFP